MLGGEVLVVALHLRSLGDPITRPENMSTDPHRGDHGCGDHRHITGSCRDIKASPPLLSTQARFSPTQPLCEQLLDVFPPRCRVDPSRDVPSLETPPRMGASTAESTAFFPSRLTPPGPEIASLPRPWIAPPLLLQLSSCSLKLLEADRGRSRIGGRKATVTERRLQIEAAMNEAV